MEPGEDKTLILSNITAKNITNQKYNHLLTKNTTIFVSKNVTFFMKNTNILSDLAF